LNTASYVLQTCYRFIFVVIFLHLAIMFIYNVTK